MVESKIYKVYFDSRTGAMKMITNKLAGLSGRTDKVTQRFMEYSSSTGDKVDKQPSGNNLQTIMGYYFMEHLRKYHEDSYCSTSISRKTYCPTFIKSPLSVCPCLLLTINSENFPLSHRSVHIQTTKRFP